MANINLVGDALVVTSAITFEDLKTVQKYKPTALTIREKDEEDGWKDVYTIGVGDNGGINQYGATFSGASRDAKKLATLTVKFSAPADPAQAKAQIADKYGFAISCINRIEAGIQGALEEIKASQKAVADAITVG